MRPTCAAACARLVPGPRTASAAARPRRPDRPAARRPPRQSANLITLRRRSLVRTAGGVRAWRQADAVAGQPGDEVLARRVGQAPAGEAGIVGDVGDRVGGRVTMPRLRLPILNSAATLTVVGSLTVGGEMRLPYLPGAHPGGRPPPPPPPRLQPPTI